VHPHQKSSRRLVIACGIAVGTLACSPNPPIEASDAPPPPMPPAAAAMPPALLERVTKSAADALGVEASAVRIVSVESVTWPDGGLGCARPDEMVIQVLTPGFRVTLAAGERTVVYHTDRRVGMRRCNTPGLRPPVTQPGTDSQ
jgi:hypothetical protein